MKLRHLDLASVEITWPLAIHTHWTFSKECEYSNKSIGSEKTIMGNISRGQHDELIGILNELIETIVIMRTEEKNYVLAQNESEARVWIDLKNIWIKKN